MPHVPTTNYLLHLVQLVLNLNNISFDSIFFSNQRTLTWASAMPVFFIGYIEHSLLQMFPGTIHQLSLYYIDNCIRAAFSTHAEVTNSIEFTTIFQTAHKFSWAISDSFLPFLDLSPSAEIDYPQTSTTNPLMTTATLTTSLPTVFLAGMSSLLWNFRDALFLHKTWVPPAVVEHSSHPCFLCFLQCWSRPSLPLD